MVTADPSGGRGTAAQVVDHLHPRRGYRVGGQHHGGPEQVAPRRAHVSYTASSAPRRRGPPRARRRSGAELERESAAVADGAGVLAGDLSAG